MARQNIFQIKKQFTKTGGKGYIKTTIVLVIVVSINNYSFKPPLFETNKYCF